jgi:hypothetical protein
VKNPCAERIDHKSIKAVHCTPPRHQRTDPDLDRIRTYIATNPATWARDALNDETEDSGLA